jgi:hypothetical protein
LPTQEEVVVLVTQTIWDRVQQVRAAVLMELVEQLTTAVAAGLEPQAQAELAAPV